MGKADIILSVEPMESLRYLPFLKPNGYLVTNSVPCKNIPSYPQMDKLQAEIDKLKRKVTINADGIAKEVGNLKASNMVMLGAASSFIEVPSDKIEEGIAEIFKSKGPDIIQLNIKAFRKGKAAANPTS
jgi:indolepyruvate ferredoxin oxidoreductase beta subunit